jgi:oxaloacetate decarboxylase alpha subunit
MAKSPYVDRVYIKDPAGMLTPDRARTLIKEVKSRIGTMPLELHSHCTIGLSPLVCMIGAELGVEVIHVAIGPLSNGTSLPSATRMIANLREHGHEVDVDEEALARVSDYFERLADAETLPKGTPQEYDAAFLRHQVPGGVMTTTRRQLKELNLEDRFTALIEEVEQVRAELGYPIMVTPFPQMVVGQALANIIGTARYANISDQVIRYVLEKFGRPTAPVDPDIKDKILSSPRAKELAAEPPPPGLKELRRKFPADMPDEEFLLRAVMPAEQVDAMMATGPASPHYNPDSRTVVSLVKELATRKNVGEITVEKPGFRLSLKGRAETAAPQAAE